jgi:hypothetical protein
MESRPFVSVDEFEPWGEPRVVARFGGERWIIGIGTDRDGWQVGRLLDAERLEVGPIMRVDAIAKFAHGYLQAPPESREETGRVVAAFRKAQFGDRMRGIQTETCPVCGQAAVVIERRDPAPGEFPPPSTSFGSWARCRAGHEWRRDVGRT